MPNLSQAPQFIESRCPSECSDVRAGSLAVQCRRCTRRNSTEALGRRRWLATRMNTNDCYVLLGFMSGRDPDSVTSASWLFYSNFCTWKWISPVEASILGPVRRCIFCRFLNISLLARARDLQPRKAWLVRALSQMGWSDGPNLRMLRLAVHITGNSFPLLQVGEAKLIKLR